MRKLFAILFALIIILLGMNLSVDTHFCGGEIVCVNLSIVPKVTHCEIGTCCEIINSPTNTESLNCCKNEKTLLQVDNIYSTSSIRLKAYFPKLFHIFYIPESIGINNSVSINTANANVLLSNHFFVSAVSLPDICKFLI